MKIVCIIWLKLLKIRLLVDMISSFYITVKILSVDVNLNFVHGS